jgi:hypothetical protein
MQNGLREALIEMHQAQGSIHGMSAEEMADMNINNLSLMDHVPEGVVVHSAISNGSLLLLSIGVLELKANPITMKVKGSEMISFRDIRGIRLGVAGKTGGVELYSVTIDRDDPGASNFGFKRAPFVIGISSSKAHLQKFQTKLSELLSGSPAGPVDSKPSESALDKLAKLKSLLDAGAITQDEFESQKSKLLGEI